MTCLRLQGLWPLVAMALGFLSPNAAAFNIVLVPMDPHCIPLMSFNDGAGGWYYVDANGVRNHDVWSATAGLGGSGALVMPPSVKVLQRDGDLGLPAQDLCFYGRPADTPAPLASVSWLRHGYADGCAEGCFEAQFPFRPPCDLGLPDGWVLYQFPDSTLQGPACDHSDVTAIVVNHAEGMVIDGIGIMVNPEDDCLDTCANVKDCIDDDGCTEDRCYDGVCEHLPIAGCCAEDGDCAATLSPCMQSTCVNQSCTEGTPIACDDGDSCTTDSCDVDLGCQHTPVAGCGPNGGSCTHDAFCDDSDLCTLDDCAAGVCAYQALECEDGVPCTVDTCAAMIGCLHAPDPGCGGDCCVEGSGPGCDQQTAEACVCSQDPYCCETRWDALCVDLVSAACGLACDASGFWCGNGACDGLEGCELCPVDCGACPSDADCCTPHPDVGCGVASVQSCVCDADPFCCNNHWDIFCVNRANAQCGAGCDDESPQAQCGDGNCDAGENCQSCASDCGACSSCGDGTCAATENCESCEADCGPCVSCGDGTCQSGHGEWCGTCPMDCGACPGSDCCVAHDFPGCDTTQVMGCVCMIDSDCCGLQWDETCVELVTSCGISCPCGDGVCDNDEGENCTTCASDCGGCEGSCCEAHEGLGCEDASLTGCVCAIHPDCCEGAWSQACVDATTMCEGACPSCGDGDCAPEAGEACSDCPEDCGYCAGEGDCCETHPEPGCGDSEIQACVCEKDSDCCETQWDEACVTVAAITCGLVCVAPECLADGDCDDDNPCTLSDCQDGLCVHLPHGGACEDGDPCTLGDVCQAGACLAGEPLACDDDNPCTADACVEGTCVQTPMPDVPCEGGGGTMCTAGFTCSATGVCQQQLDDCDDQNPDTMDSCHVLRGCGHTQHGMTYYDAGWVYDTKTKLGWFYDGTLKNYAAAQATCSTLEMPGVNSWALPKIDQLRDLITGCPDTETGGTCPLADPGCLDAICGNYGFCTACTAGVGGAYLKAGFTPPGLVSPANLFSRSPVANVPKSVWAVGLSSGSVYQRETWWKTLHTCVTDFNATWVFSWGSFDFSWP